MSNAMRIVLFCATQRGYRALERLAALAPEAELIVFTFREEPHEPPFLDDIRGLCERVGATCYEAKWVGTAKWQSFWESTDVDLILTVSWRYMIPSSVYKRARLGAFVFHDSPLPRYRGFAPTVWAIINGETETGVTLFEMADAVDSGAIIAQELVPIGQDNTIAEVMEQVTQTYLHLLERYLPALVSGSFTRIEQDQSLATFTCKRLPEDNQINWNASTRDCYNLIRAVTRPYPGAFTTLAGEKWIIWRAEWLPNFPPYVGRIPGRIVEIHPNRGVVVLTGDGALLITEVGREGEASQPAADVFNSLSMTLAR